MEEGYRQHQQWVRQRRAALEQRLSALFPSPSELSLEIGCGHGHWLTDFAAQRPDKRFLGIDIVGDRIERAQRKKDRAGLGNVDFVKAEAMETLDLLPGDVAAREVFILFPDPWPKKRHWKKRLFSERFLEQLGRRCPTGASCYFRTDHPDYFLWAEEVVARQSLWERQTELDWPFERETVFQAKAGSYQSLRIVKS